MGFPTAVHLLPPDDRKYFTAIYPIDSPQMLLQGSVNSLFYISLKLLFHHGDLLCEIFPSVQESYRLGLLKSEEKQTRMLPLMHANFYFF